MNNIIFILCLYYNFIKGIIVSLRMYHTYFFNKMRNYESYKFFYVAFVKVIQKFDGNLEPKQKIVSIRSKHVFKKLI